MDKKYKFGSWLPCALKLQRHENKTAEKPRSQNPYVNGMTLLEKG